jgi:hypothetical protein
MRMQLRAGRGVVEIGLIAALYWASELSRGLAGGGAEAAQQHAADVVSLERRLHIFGEGAVQDAVHRVAGLPSLLGYAYLGLHLALTAATLVWVFRRHPHAYPALRNTLFLANAIAVVGYWRFPTAPPRLADVGIADTVSHATTINLSSRFVSALYNPYAAVPSMHIGFSLIVGLTVVGLARSPLIRAAAALYPALVLLVIVATGNHFFLDAAAGALVAGLAAGAVALAGRRRASGLVQPHVAHVRDPAPEVVALDRLHQRRPGRPRHVLRVPHGEAVEVA